jgi:hypothetical protein
LNGSLPEAPVNQLNEVQKFGVGKVAAVALGVDRVG